MKLTRGTNFLQTSNLIRAGLPRAGAAVLILAAVLSGISCGGTDTVTLDLGGNRIYAEVARTAKERAAGLMHRKSLKDDHGMIFVYDHDEKLSFWMKNTSIPLSIAFIAHDGTIKQIEDMTPFSERTIESAYSVRYALEVKQGTFASLGMEAGDRIIFPADFR